jgi:mRNA-degrading endonuclease RelE of RelBE toxin-antitoxin system
MLKRFLKSCQKVVKDLSKICQKSFQKVVKKLSKSCQKSCQKVFNELSKSCQKVVTIFVSLVKNQKKIIVQRIRIGMGMGRRRRQLIFPRPGADYVAPVKNHYTYALHIK